MTTQTYPERIFRPGTIEFITAAITLSDIETKRDANYITTPGAAPVIRVCTHGQGPKVKRFLDATGFLYNVDGDTKEYYPLLDKVDLVGPGCAWSDSLGDAQGTITLIDYRLPWQKIHSGGAIESAGIYVKLSQLFADYNWRRAPIVIKSCVEQFNYDADPTTGVAFHEHKGQKLITAVITGVVEEDDRLIISYGPDDATDVSFPDSQKPTGGLGPAIITKKDYPKAPDQYVGQPIPMTFTRRGAISLFNGYFPNFVSPYLLDGLVPCVVTELAPSTSRLLRIVANKWENFGATPSSSSPVFFIVNGENNLLSISTGNSVGTGEEIYQDVDHSTPYTLPVAASIYKSKTGGVTNAERAIDGKLTTYASLANTGSTVSLELAVPYLSSLGRIIDFGTYIAFDGTSVGAGASGGTLNAEFGLWNVTTAAWALPTNNTGGKNPGQLAKADVNAGTQVMVSSLWAKGAHEWNTPTQPIANWRWEEYNSGADRAEELRYRVNVVENGCTLNAIAGGLYINYLPFTPNDFIYPRGKRTVKR